jgi:hypothetical protein
VIRRFFYGHGLMRTMGKEKGDPLPDRLSSINALSPISAS